VDLQPLEPANPHPDRQTGRGPGHQEIMLKWKYNAL